MAPNFGLGSGIVRWHLMMMTSLEIITQADVKKALAFRTFWIVLHILTCAFIIAGNGRSLGIW